MNCGCIVRPLRPEMSVWHYYFLLSYGQFRPQGGTDPGISTLTMYKFPVLLLLLLYCCTSLSSVPSGHSRREASN